MPYEVTGTLWLGVAPPAKVGEWVLFKGPPHRPYWTEVDGWWVVAGGTFIVRYKDEGRRAVVLGASKLEWRRPPSTVKRPWPRTVTVRD